MTRKRRDTLLDDYACKDALLQTFRETGAYSSDPEQYMLPIRHVRMNATLVLIAAWTCWVAKFVLGWSLRVVTRRVGISFVVLFLMHAFTHLHAERISGASRARRLFETVPQFAALDGRQARPRRGFVPGEGPPAESRLAPLSTPVATKKKKKRPPARSLPRRVTGALLGLVPDSPRLVLRALLACVEID